MDFANGSGSEEDPFDDEEEWTEIIKSLCNTEQQNQSCVYIKGGVHIKFPKETAYESQDLMMDHIIDGVQKSENCLLESPTGTGKTLAILCSLLAWQRHCKRKNDRGCVIDQGTLKQKCTCGFIQGLDPSTFKILQGGSFDKGYVLQRHSFVYIEEKIPSDTDTTHSPKKKKVEVKKLNPVPDEIRRECQLCRYCIRSNFVETATVPTIYYATRTGTVSQVEQVVGQLKTTAYSGSKMTILAGRSHYCTNLDVTKPYLPVDDTCLKLRENYSKNRRRGYKSLPECEYYQGGTNGSNERIYRDFMDLHEIKGTSWDIEDIKSFSRRQCSCAFYGSKSLLDQADVVFCTYNYLLNAGIRKLVKINLINSVLVFDEAHNIEDLCRDIASLQINQNCLKNKIIPTFQNALFEEKKSQISSILNNFLTLFTKFCKWFDDQSENIVFDPKVKKEDFISFSNGEIEEELTELGFGIESVHNLYDDIKTLEEHIRGGGIENGDGGELSVNDNDIAMSRETIEEYRLNHLEVEPERPDNSTFANGDNQSKSSEKKSLNFELIQYVRNVLKKLKLIFGSEEKLIKDYSAIFLKKAYEVVQFGKGKVTFFSNELHIICLNPAVTFKQLKNSSHSIIVTSGTLSPLDSFESELDTPFPIKLSAPHVIQRSRVFAATAEYGPENFPLIFDKSGQLEHNSQDELGRAIFKICTVVPHGILVFFPSYHYLEQLKLRWGKFPENRPMLQQLQSCKKVYFEDSKKTKEDFKAYIQDYRTNAMDTSSNGSILFAVFRGKVSEGEDFKDNQARAVLTVGIPFGNPTEAKIDKKMKYNDTMRRKHGRSLLSGRDWYKTQAFRAKNQAFGRCVRHQNDWGTIILLEKRMASSQYSSYLSHWVREGLQRYFKFDELLNKVKVFCEEKEKASIALQALRVSEMETLFVDENEVLTEVVDLAKWAELQNDSKREGLPILPALPLNEKLNGPSESDEDLEIDVFGSASYESDSSEPCGTPVPSQCDDVTERLQKTVYLITP